MKLIHSNLLNSFWKKGIVPIKAELEKKIATSKIVNNLLTTKAGYVLDARQGKVLQDQVTEINSNLSGMCIYTQSNSDRVYSGFVFTENEQLNTDPSIFEYSAGGILVQPGIYEVLANFHALEIQGDICGYYIITADATGEKEAAMINFCAPATVQSRKQVSAIIKINNTTRILLKFNSDLGTSCVLKSTESGSTRVTIKRI